MGDFIKRIVIGALGGFAGGSLAGIAEGAVVAATGGAEEYWVFLFGAVAYGVFGTLMGAGIGFVASILPPLREERMVLAAAGGLSAAALTAVFARFRIIRDVFGESLPIASGAGIAVHVGLLVLAAVIVFLLGRALANSADSRGATASGAMWAVGSVIAGALLAVVLNAVATPGDAALTPGAATAKGPNVILLIADTLRADHISPYGAENVNTPGLDRLASDAVVFENAFAHSSWTRPSIATILTSLYPASHSVMYKTDLLPEAVVTIAESLKEEGYRTSGFVTNINVAPSFNFQQGFDSYEYLSPDFFFGATDSGSKLSLYSGMRLIRERFLSSSKSVNQYYQDGETVNAIALPWLDDHAGEPFFSLIHYMDPHDPYFEIPYNGRAVARVENPHPAPERAEELRKLYISNIEYMDTFIVGLIDQLEKAGVYENTVIAFVADHGEEFYEHGGWWHGTTMYDEQIHVPLIVKLAKNSAGGSRREDLAGMVDVTPTLLAAVGGRVPDGAQGRDLFGDTKAPPALYGEEDHEGNVLESIRTPEWKLITANAGNPRGLPQIELFHVGRDPGEQQNLAATQPERVAELKAQLELLKQLAAKSAVSGVSGEIDAATEEKLRALGYIE